jgi:hypothetical protein
MPVEFLSDEQVAAYGRFDGPPTRTQLERSFFLNDADRELVNERRRDHTRLGFGVQLATVRYLGTLLADPTDVPREVAEYVAGQLAIPDAGCLVLYAAREPTHREHAGEIQRVFGYRDFAEAEDELRSFIVARCSTTAEEPKALFDRAVAWLIEHKVLLPGVTTLARLVASLRGEAAESLSLQIVEGVDIELRGRLIGALDVGTGSRFSDLERFRKSAHQDDRPGARARAQARG